MVSRDVAGEGIHYAWQRVDWKRWLCFLDDGKLWILSYCFVITGYCYSIGPVFGALLGVRGIQPTLPVGNIVFCATNTIASLSILFGLGLTIYGGRNTCT